MSIMDDTTLEFFGATTYRLRTKGVTIFLDTWLDRPLVLPKYLDINDVSEADYIFISHAHFDHLPGADRIAIKAGAIVVANCEAIRCLRQAGVPEEQLLPVQGEIMDTGTVYTDEEPYASSLDITVGMKYGLLRLRDVVPEESMDDGMKSFCEYIEDRQKHVFSHCDGGQLMFNFIIDGKALWSAHLGGYEGILKTVEPKPQIAILAVAGRANLNGRPFIGSAAQFISNKVQWLGQPKQVIWCLHDESCIGPRRIDTRAATETVERETSSRVLDLEPARPIVLNL